MHRRIGSVTKTFTGTAVLQLVDRGLVIAWAIRSRATSRECRPVTSITLDLLGRMHSGLFDYIEDDTLLERLYAESPAGPDAFAFTPHELLDIAFAHPPNFRPGAQYQYSNTNLVLLGMVIEKVTGQPLDDYLAAEHLRTARPDADQLSGGWADATTLSARLHPVRVTAPRSTRPSGTHRGPTPPARSSRTIADMETMGRRRGEGRLASFSPWSQATRLQTAAR